MKTNGYENDPERKKKLLEHYAGKPVRRFLQIDAGWIGHGDDVETPDLDGDVVLTAVRDELQASNYDVRLRIHESADPHIVCRLLRKVVCYLEKYGDEAMLWEFTDWHGTPMPEEEARSLVLGADGGEFSVLTGDGEEGERYPGWYGGDNP